MFIFLSIKPSFVLYFIFQHKLETCRELGQWAGHLKSAGGLNVAHGLDSSGLLFKKNTDFTLMISVHSKILNMFNTSLEL